MTNQEKLLCLCETALKDKNLDESYKKRLDLELKEIYFQNEVDYFLDLHINKARYNANQNNLLVPFLLGITPTFDVTKEYKYICNEFPDCDVDFSFSALQKYLKNEWAPKTFGADKVCNIGSYNTFGIKSSLKDMSRVFSKNYSEIEEVTKELKDKDDDGKPLSWDKALALYPNLKKYCEDNLDVADAAHKLLNRNKSVGKHAGGLIISSVSIDNFIPLLKGKDGMPVSSWVEGLHGQDLGPMGLVKFDVLCVSGVLQIGLACKLIKERHNLTSICALPGQSDWSDTSYLEDAKALEMANKGDLKCIFQFDSAGIRQMVKDGGVTCFNDLVAYSSLYRPAAMVLKMHERYIQRKRGRETYEKHPLLDPFLDKTYGVLCIQKDTFVSLADGRELPISSVKQGMMLHSLNLDTYKFEPKECHGCGPTRNGDGVKVTIDNGYSIILTPDHPVLTYTGMKPAGELQPTIDLIAVPKILHNKVSCSELTDWCPRQILIDNYKISSKTEQQWAKDTGVNVQHLSSNKIACVRRDIVGDLAPERPDVRYLPVKSVEIVHDQVFYGISVADHHNLVANGVVVHNCYQEQIMRLLNVVGEIPLKDCEILRKAVSKKKIEYFLKYKLTFIENGQKNLGWSEEKINYLWLQIEAFSGYAFNLSVLTGTLIPTRNNKINKSDDKVYNKKIEDFIPGDIVFCVDEAGVTVETPVIALHDHGILPGFEVIFDDGSKVVCTLEHKFLTRDGQKSLREIIDMKYDILCDPSVGQQENSNYASKKNGWMGISLWRNIPDTASDVGTQQELLSLSRKIVYDGRVGGSLWTEIQDENFGHTTPIDMSRVSEISVEDKRGGGWTISIQAEYYSLRNSIEYSRVGDKSPEELSDLRGNQEGKYYSQKYEIKSIKLAENGCIKSGENNFCSSGNSAAESRAAATLAGSQSGEICQNYRGCLEVTKTIQNGNLAKIATWLGDVYYSMWRYAKTSGFCTWQNLDGNRWILPFLRESAFPKQQEKTADACRGTTERFNVEQGSATAGRCDANSFEHGMFCEFDGRVEDRMVGLAASHAPIRDTRRLVRRNILRVTPVGNGRMYDIEVANPTHNFLLPSGIVTSNSHATAYTYLSSRGLWLKAHYSIEFYAAVLSCEQGSEKTKDYKRDADKHKIKLLPVDINKSGVDFNIIDNKIYFGLASIKGISKKMAQKIVDGQPYVNLDDFLTRFGTEGVIVKPLIGLRCFGDDAVALYKQYEQFKLSKKAEVDKQKRQELKRQKLLLLLPKVWHDLADFASLDKIEEVYKEAFQKSLTEEVSPEIQEFLTPWTEDGKVYESIALVRRLHKGYNASKSQKPKKEPKEPKKKPKVDILKVFASQEESEKMFYGFLWTHPLEKHPDYQGFTFDGHRTEGKPVNPVEVHILSAKETLAKNQKTVYWLLRVEDANCEEQLVQVWMNDWERFSEELQEGNFVSLRLKAPEKFRRYTLDSPPRHMRYKLPNKNSDGRVVKYAITGQ